ncbi:unnamed protein product [Staurois parvus]|uniref:Uncharacterized protein n=1 Tax=Staurois parvus TaxID=386267 RepID=A0ABN9A937_9NEOB|nr:unnamed protein product [Staurois parvus]
MGLLLITKGFPCCLIVSLVGNPHWYPMPLLLSALVLEIIFFLLSNVQGRTDHMETRALPEGPGSVGGPMRFPWYLFHRLF